MSKSAASNNKKKLVPKLRFPEFHRDGEWKEGPFDKVYEFKQTNSLSRDSLNYTSGPVKNIHYGDIHTKFSTLFDITKEFVPFVNDESLLGAVRPEAYCQVGDMVFADASEDIDDIGKSIELVNLNGERVVSGQHTLLARQRHETFVKGFGGYLFKSGLVRSGIKKEAQGAKVLGISTKRLAKIDLVFPASRDEQQKIADCLSSLDALIAAHTDKLAALKAHKKGLLQQLFPRDGETIPRLRFPEFRNAGAWREVALGEIAEIKLGKMLDSKKHTTGKLLPYLNNLSVRWNSVDTANLPEMYFNANELDRYGLRKGDVVVCEGGDPGRSAVWDGRLPDVKFQKAIHRVRFNIPFEPNLLALYLESISGTTRLEKLFTGGGIKHLTREVFANLKIPVASHDEQRKIANFLSNLDNLITTQANKIAALKQHKQGLLQQLFPAMDEITV